MQIIRINAYCQNWFFDRLLPPINTYTLTMNTKILSIKYANGSRIIMSLISMLFLSLFTACNSEDEVTNEENKAPNWEIISNFPQDKSYEIAKLAGYENNIFLTTYGHRKLPSIDTYHNNLFGSFFFKSDGYWYVNERENNAVIALKEFNGELYGIRLNRTVFATTPVVKYHQTYTLFKWKNDKYEDIDTLDYTSAHQIGKEDIGDVDLWIFNNKLHVIARATSVLVWEINNNKFVKKPEELAVMVDNTTTIDNKEVSFTKVSQIIISETRTRYIVQGFFYNGSTFRNGQVFDYIVEGDTGFSNKEADGFQSFDGHTWGIGYQSNKIKNLETQQIIPSVADGKVLRSFPIITNNEKVFITVGTQHNYSKCESIVVFDGSKSTEIPFKLPEILDPNSTVIDAIYHQGKVHLLLNNRGQYVVVKNI